MGIERALGGAVFAAVFAPVFIAMALVAGGCQQAEHEHAVTPQSVAMRVAALNESDRSEVLAATFETLGLATFGGAADFRQPFTVQSYRADSVRVVLDGELLPASRVAASLSSGAISWSDGDSVSVVHVGPENDPMLVWHIWRGATGRILMLIDASHRDRFPDVARRIHEPVLRLIPPGGLPVGLPGSDDRGADEGPGQDLVAVLLPGAMGRGVRQDAGAVPPFQVTAVSRATDHKAVNVVGLLPGERAKESVIYSASAAHVSGAAALMELATHYARRPRPERTLVFVLYAERSTTGSEVHFGAQHMALSLDPTGVVAQLHLDRVGSPSAMTGGSPAWMTGYDRTTLGPILTAGAAGAAGDAGAAGTVGALGPDPYPWFNLHELLDHAPLADRGVVAHSVGSSPVVDTGGWLPEFDAPEVIDPGHMARVIQFLIRGMDPVVEGDVSP